MACYFQETKGNTNNYFVLLLFIYRCRASSRIIRNHSATILVNGIVLAIVPANGKAYYNAYNFAIYPTLRCSYSYSHHKRYSLRYSMREESPI